MGYTIALIRHGESVWNVANIFTGWTDVDLTEVGIREATLGGRLLRTQGFEFDLAYTLSPKACDQNLQHSARPAGPTVDPGGFGSSIGASFSSCTDRYSADPLAHAQVTKEWRLNVSTP